MNDIKPKRMVDLINELHTYYCNREIHSLDKILNMLLAEEFDRRYGILNSAFLDMFVMHGGDASMTAWYKVFQRDMLDAGMMALPEWMHNAQDVKRIQGRIAAVADDLSF